MREIASIGVQTVIVSWWGPGSAEAARLPAVDAGGAGRRPAGRAARRAVPGPDARGARAGAPRVRRPPGSRTSTSTTRPRRRTPTGARSTSGLPGVRLFANTSLPGKAQAGGFAGLYTYDVYVYDGSSFPRDLRVGAEARPALRPVGRARATTPRATGDTRVREAGGRRHLRPHVAGRDPGRRPTSSRSRATTSGTRARRSSRRRRSERRTRPTTAPTASSGARRERAYLDRTAVWVRRYRDRASAADRSSVERRREAAAVGADERVVRAEAARTAPPRPPAGARARPPSAAGTASTMSCSAPSTSPASSAATTLGQLAARREAPRAACRRAAARAARRGTCRPPCATALP